MRLWLTRAFEVVCGPVHAWSKPPLPTNFHEILTTDPRTKSKQLSGESDKEKPKEEKEKKSLITEHSGVTAHETTSNCSFTKCIALLPSQKSQNKKHIWANCWSRIKISMWDLRLYPNHMAWLREAVRVPPLHQNTATPTLILCFISLSEDLRALFHKIK